MARIISKRILEEIRFRNDIVEVIQSYLNLKKSGSTYKAICPFHKEKTPSFHVNSQRQIWHCFGCGAGGDVFGFIMEREGVDFVTAAKMLADRSGVNVELEEDDSGTKNKNELFKINKDAASFYNRTLLKGRSAAVARAYLKKRELDQHTVEEFMIGFAPDQWDAVLKGAEKKNYTVDQLETVGLVICKEKSKGSGVRCYDRFRNRIMFPIHDEQDRIVGFSGRTLETDDRGAKYVNTPETPLFKKSRILYGLNKARRNIVDAGEAIICEGQVDVIRCHQAGFNTAVAPQGTSFTEDHVRIVNRYADSVVIAFDQDVAGQNAAIKTARLFMDAGVAVRIAALPEGQDPDSFILKEGAEAFRALMEGAVSVVAYQIQALSSREKAHTEVGLMRISREILDTISRSPNSVQKAKLIQEAADRLGVPASALSDELKRATRRRSTGGRDNAGRRGKKKESRPPDEVALCECIIHIQDYPGIEKLVRGKLPLEFFTDQACRAVAEACLDASQKGEQVHEAISFPDNPPEGLQEFFAYVLMQPSKIRGDDLSIVDAAKDAILAMWRKKLKAERETLPEGSERRTQITMDLKALRTWETGASIIEMEMEG